MKLTKKQINDLKNIMSVEEEMIPLLSLFKPKNRILNPWEKEFPKIFKDLKLKKGMKVLDIPCGQGGVSVPLARKYGVKVVGYDILPSYVRYARKYAKEKGVSHLCRFIAKDIRSVVKEKNICDILLWIGPPHIWGRSNPTIKKLRTPVRNGGIIVIADAYLYPGVKRKGMYADYESLKDTNKGFTSSGDEIIEFHDYKTSLWTFDYNRTRKEVAKAMKRAKTLKNKNIVKRCLSALDSFQDREMKNMGLGIWVIRVRK